MIWSLCFSPARNVPAQYNNNREADELSSALNWPSPSSQRSTYAPPTMKPLPPGVPFLARSLLALSFYPLLIVASARLFHRFAGLAIPVWLVPLLALASVAASTAATIALRERRVRRAAARLGAVLPPRWDGRAIGHVDLLRSMVHEYKNGYIADNLMLKLGELSPTMQTNILWDRAYITTDPQAIKSILATDFANYVKGEAFDGYMRSVLGTGVFNSDGDMWKWHRAMTRPFFSRDRISHFELFDRHAEEALDRMGARFRAGHAVDFQDLISRFTLDSATEFLFGATVHSLRTPLPVSHNAAPPLSSSTPPSSQSISAPDSSYAFLHSGEAAEPPSSQAFSTAFNGAMQVISDRPRLGLIWPLFEMFRNKSDKYMRVVDAFLAPILEEAVRKREEKHWRGKKDDEGAEEEEEDEEGTLLDSLVRYTKDPVVLHDEVLNILLAGRDTTACSLTFAVYFLSTHPHVLRQLRAEVLAKVGTRRRPTYEDIKEMRYLRAVINETLRLYPPVPWNVRYSARETTLLNPDPSGKPFYVPPNTPISWSALAMHRRTDLWGPDAMEFDPDRFLDERVHKYLTPNPFIFLPFNAGPRICLGQQFAYNEISFFLIKLLQRFSDMELDLAAQPPSSLPPQEWTGSPGRKGVEKFFPKTHLTMYALGGLWVRMTEADEPKVDSASSQADLV